ncbi:MAG: class D beta-lactamase [Verrucomicrobia bacterium]|nr:class D beta-lactamase [Cytophagales bacterium]
MPVFRNLLVVCYFLCITPLLAQGFKISENDVAQVFKDFQATGTLVLYDLQQDKYLIHNPIRAKREFSPAFTYKILNSLIALETQVIANEKEVIAWDSVKREFESWNRDHNLKTAIEASAVPFYQELARRIGEKRMKKWVQKVGYGNQDISGGIDQFWLSGGLRITAVQQIEFLKRLYQNKLPFSEKNMVIVRKILINEEKKTYTLRAKTGWAFQEKIGWWVGYLESKDNTYFFAMNMDLPEGMKDVAKRQAITKAVMQKAGWLAP